MCGIAGIFGAPSSFALEAKARRMAGALGHRGPDGEGVWFDHEIGLALAHRRLSILDLSNEGNQPMASFSQRYVAVFNGEIYNFSEIRRKLVAQGVAPLWRGSSDTEVMLAAIDAWGIEETLQSLVGMFALAVWDQLKHSLTLARDRAGEKPLYYGITKNGFVFASELKAICAAVDQPLALDRSALAEYMRFGYVPKEQCIYSGITKLLPGHYVEIGPGNQIREPKAFWRLHSGAGDVSYSELGKASDVETINFLNDLLKTSVGLQMVSDVPLGAFLSGGIDSSLIVALMQQQSAKQVKTFTMGFHEQSFDEAPFAASIARHLGTEHHSLYVGAADALKVIPSLPYIYDEPFADSSQIPTILLSQLTRDSVKVALCGDGGDELFGGYERYKLAARLARNIRVLPKMLRNQSARLLASPSQKSWDKIFKLLPTELYQKLNGRRLNLLAHLIKSNDFSEIYIRLMSQVQPEELLVLGVPLLSSNDNTWSNDGSLMEQMRRWDFLNYLPDDLLVKVDRASMSTSLEVRSPFLDHRVVETAFAMPDHFLQRGGEAKWVLRRLLDRYVPSELVDRPKSGFSVPLGDWLRGPLKDWAHDLLDPAVLLRQGFLNVGKVQKIMQEHQSGLSDRSSALWNILMFQLWMTKEKVS